ncbi:alpha/beta-hydrolase [Basidiobolus meristosporus CBS 931.73]|uniref:Alpha/beta-hydrolase n=1 Tax=Basidiobolus meristosporus CBS 931.73 TaxID=1314790 RepID=A0A1Y1Z0S1_9FUNG|nr:alpha/beta-hydrolase [Basidiobolus meristosporus CBS 931.73]|eukprot:ORY03809.1 alpha/beta-hydrolase [Basidiobolus meristosporus CBS 931.73]
MPAPSTAPVAAKKAEDSETFAVVKALAQLWSEGLQVRWDVYYSLKESPSQKVPLPSYAFDRKRHMLKKARASFTSVATVDIKANQERPSIPIPEDSILEQITPTEEMIQKVWQSFLYLDSPPSVESDYFELGGDSMMAVQLVGKISELFPGVDLGIHALLRNPTIKGLAKVIDSMTISNASNGDDTAAESNVNDSTSTLRTINLSSSNDEILVQLKNGLGNPVFLVHPVGGDIFGFRSLINQLASNITVYAFRAPFFTESRKSPYADVKEMAAAYVQLLLSKLDANSRQNIHLGGHSMGGVVVYEMVQQLNSLGCNVSRIILLDPPLNPVSSSVLARSYFMPVLEDPVDIAEYIFGHRVNLPPDDRAELAHLPLTVAISKVCSLLSRDIETLGLKKLSGLEKNRENIVLYIKNSEADGYFPTYAHVAYQDAMLSGGFDFRLVQVPGSHQTMLLDPNVQYIAAAIVQFL